MNLFGKRKYVPINKPPEGRVPVIPDGLWVKCGLCGKTVYSKDLTQYKLCPHCKGCFRLSAPERINLITDPDSFAEMNKDMVPKNPLDYPQYLEKIQAISKKTGLKEAVVTGTCSINGSECVMCVMDSHFIMGSMGSVVGEKITRAFEYATEKKLPVVVFAASGGARMQEGIVSLMQMAKISQAVAKHSEAGLLYIAFLTDPTTGGVTASFAMLADIILAEPGALIGFTGRRVIEQTIKQTLPDDFQKAEHLLQHGFIDRIVQRQNIKSTLATILKLHQKREIPKEQQEAE